MCQCQEFLKPNVRYHNTLKGKAMNINNEEEVDKLYDFMSKISFLMIKEIEELRKYKSDTEVLDDIIEKFKYNISLCPEAALEIGSCE